MEQIFSTALPAFLKLFFYNSGIYVNKYVCSSENNNQDNFLQEEEELNLLSKLLVSCCDFLNSFSVLGVVITQFQDSVFPLLWYLFHLLCMT